MSLTNLSQMIRALAYEPLNEEDRGLVQQAYQRSSAGTKVWHLTQKEQEHIAVIFGRIYREV